MYMTKREELPAWALFLIALLVEVCLDLFGRLILVSACSGNELLCDRYYKLVIITLCAFVAGFIATIVTKKTVPTLITSAFVHFTVGIIVLGFSWGLIFLNLLYFVSAVIGICMAYIALTHKG